MFLCIRPSVSNLKNHIVFFICQINNILACILALITSLLKSRVHWPKYQKKKCVVLVSRITNLYVKHIPDIKKVFSFDDIEQLGCLPNKIRISLHIKTFLKPQQDFRFYQTTKQCSLPQVGRSWGANTFPLGNQSLYPISKTSQGSQ